MKKHIVYITSDANRIHLEAGYCQDLNFKIFELQSQSSLLLSNKPKAIRIIHVEEYDSYEAAQKRKNELNLYTRMQKEKVIRKHNPNWLSINTAQPSYNKKTVVFA